MAGVEQIIVGNDEQGMRLDRWFKVHFPGLGFGHLQKLLRSGQIRVDGGRVKADSRVEPGQTVRIPPLAVDRKGGDENLTGHSIRNQGDADVLAKMLLHEDDKVFVFNKPAGLAVQGGSGVTRHVDDMLEAWRSKKGEKPRLVHRLDRDTSGVLVVARTRLAAMKLAEAFRARETKKTYWALVKGVPKKREDKISTWLVKETTPDGDRMRVAKHGEEGADHAVSYYRVLEQAGQTMCWLEMEPYTGRTHQLRVHAAHIGNPIIGDPKYFEADTNWDFPGGMQNRLHLHARRIIIPHPVKGMIDVTAPMPPHMRQSWNLIGFNEASADEDEVTHGIDFRPPRRRRCGGGRDHDFPHLLVGPERRRAEAFECRLQSGIRFAVSCRPRGIAGLSSGVSPAGIPLFNRDGTLPAGLLAGLPVRRGIPLHLRRVRLHLARTRLADGQHHAFLGADRCAFPAGRAHERSEGGRCRARLRRRLCHLFRPAGLARPDAWIGDLLTLLAGILWAATTLVIKKSPARDGGSRKSCCSINWLSRP